MLVVICCSVNPMSSAEFIRSPLNNVNIMVAITVNPIILGFFKVIFCLPFRYNVLDIAFQILIEENIRFCIFLLGVVKARAKIIFCYGEQNTQIKKILDTRRFVLDSMQKLKTR